jgi:hypothetical protein
MRSVPNSPPVRPSTSPPLEDNLDLFPPLPAAYPASYINTPIQVQVQVQVQPAQQQLHAHDDEAILYSNRLRKNIDLASQHSRLEHTTALQEDFQGSVQSLKQYQSPVASAKVYRPRSASVSQKQPVAVPTRQGLSSSSSTNNLHQHFKEGHYKLGLTRRHSDAKESNNEAPPPPAKSEGDSTGDPATPRRICNDDLKKCLQQRGLVGYDDVSSQSAYTPLSYAAYAQSMYNHGGVGGIPTPLTREILSFVESVDAFGAKMQRWEHNASFYLF